MLLQCLKCSLFFRSFPKLKTHKVGLCADKPKTLIKAESTEQVEDVTSAIAATNLNQDNENTSTKVEIKQEIKTEVKEEPVEFSNFPSRLIDPVHGFEPEEVYVPAPVVTIDDSDDEFEPESDDSAPDDDDVEAELGLARKIATKTKTKRKRRAVEAGKVVYITMSSGQKVKKFVSSKPEGAFKFIPKKAWIPYRTQVTVKQVCQYLELRDFPLASSPTLRTTCRDRAFFDALARPLARAANPNTHPLVMDTFLRAKWFELMNTQEEEQEEAVGEEEVRKRKAVEDTLNLAKVKRIKLNVAR